MKTLIAILILVAVAFVGWRVYDYWDNVSSERDARAKAALPPPVDPERLPGLPWQLEQSLQEAKKRGAPGLKTWLDTYKRSPSVQDPRLGSIELDYALSIAAENPLESKRIFADVKKRTPNDSPLYRRIKELEKTFE